MTEPLKAEAREAVRRATPLGAAAARTTETGVKEMADIVLMRVRCKSEDGRTVYGGLDVYLSTNLLSI